MDLQQRINEMFQGHAEILSLNNFELAYWRNMNNRSLSVSFADSLRSFTKEAQREIEGIEKTISRNDPHAYVIALDYSDDEVRITTINCTFAELKYMRSSKSKIKPKILSANGIYITNDDFIAVNHRAGNLATYPGCYHVTGGSANPLKDNTLLDIFLREGKEEVAIQESETKDITILSLAKEPTTGFYQVNLSVPLKIPSAEIKKRKGDGEGKMVYVENKPDIFKAWLLENWEKCVPSGLAQFLIYGAKTFRQSWADELLDQAQGKRFAEAYQK